MYISIYGYTYIFIPWQKKEKLQRQETDQISDCKRLEIGEKLPKKGQEGIWGSEGNVLYLYYDDYINACICQN